MPLQSTSGAASYDAFGGGVAVLPKYIEDYFSAFLYTGNGSTQTINNGIDLSTKGGLVWGKNRDGNWSHYLADTARGTGKFLESNTTSANTLDSTSLTAFNANGFSIGNAGAFINNNGVNYVSWTWAKAPKFFDVVTWTGDSTPRTIAHNLGSVPGCIMVKCTSMATDWNVYHQSLGNTFRVNLNQTSAAVDIGDACWNATTPTSTVFSLGTNSGVNSSGSTYVAYLFAHNAGGFGLTGTDNVISCGSFTLDGSNTAIVTLGYEPQWVMIKRTNATSNWVILDNMRGLTTSGVDAALRPNTSGAETNGQEGIYPTATGFGANTGLSSSGDSYIYIAIRRGPMKVPTSGTSVFGITTAAGTSPAYVSSFPVDVALRYQITGGDPTLQARLTGPKKGFTDYNFAESNDSNVTWDYQNGMFTTVGANANQYGWLMRRAPSFMDVVCYTGTGSATTQSHNLGAVPELMIVKRRNTDGFDWIVYSSPTGNNNRLLLNDTVPAGSGTSFWNDTTPTSSVFTLGNNVNVNGSTGTYIAYLFATAAGVSKVGSYTGTGALQTINCGFTGGARFVLIKRTDSTGDWYVYDTNRGMTSGNDPYWFINTADAQVTGTNYVDTDSTGFKVTAAAPAGLNASGGTYIFLAIA